jgi:hypothetical protein
MLAACGSSSANAPATGGPSGPFMVYVHPGGRGPGAPEGTGTGTRALPYTSLVAARDALRPRLAGMNGDATVVLGSGTYSLTSPFTLTSADSGSNGHTVRYQAAPGAHPVISGGYEVTGWHQKSGQAGIWEAPLPSWLDTRQIYVDGTRAPVAQGPLPVTLTQTATGYTASSTAFDSWPNPSDLEFVYPSGPSNWTESRCRVASISGVTVTMSQPCWDNTTKRATPGTSLNRSGFGQALTAAPLATNALPLLTTPGQWYLDHLAHKLYYRPLPGQSMATAQVMAPRLQTLVRGIGTATAPVHDIAFLGITFAYATWLGPSSSNGYSAFQAGTYLTGPGAYRLQGACNAPTATCPYTNYSQMPGNVSFSYDRNLTFAGDTFTHLGAVGLSIGDGSQNDTVTTSLFTDTSGSGLAIGGIDQPGAPQSMRTSGDRVTNDYFHGTSAEFQDNAALFVGYAQGISIRHNQIDGVPYSGISIGWGGWQERLPGKAPLANSSSGNLIDSNLVFDHMTTIVDGGGIYTNGIEGSSMANSERIEGNVVLGQHHPSWAVYTDNGTEYVTVGSNVVWDALYVPQAPTYVPGLSPYWSFGGCGGGPIAYSDNWSVQPDPVAGLISANAACGGHPLKGVTSTGNHVLTSFNQIPTTILGTAGLEPRYRHLFSLTPIPTTLPAWSRYPA